MGRGNGNDEEEDGQTKKKAQEMSTSWATGMFFILFYFIFYFPFTNELFRYYFNYRQLPGQHDDRHCTCPHAYEPLLVGWIVGAGGHRQWGHLCQGNRMAKQQGDDRENSNDNQHLPHCCKLTVGREATDDGQRGMRGR